MKFKSKLFILITMIMVLCVQGTPSFAAAEDGQKLDLRAKAAIVMDAQTGEILYEKDIDVKRQPASTTKIVTCMLALEHLSPDQIITVNQKVTDMGSCIDIKEGETFAVEDLLYGLMLASGNDAAEALAYEVGGSIEKFCQMMDEKAKDCGAQNTHFRNPNGLNWQGQEDHLTTARDLALITKEAMKNEMFRKLVSTSKHTIPATNKSKARKLVNSNKCLWRKKPIKLTSGNETEKKTVKFVPKYDGMIGVKTGYTSTAGGCLVGAVNRNGTELISVVLGSGEDGRYYDTNQLNDYVLDNFYETSLIVSKGQEMGKLRVKKGAVRKVTAVAAEDASVTTRAGEDAPEVRTEFEEKKNLEAPVAKGQRIGSVRVYIGNKLMSETNAIAEETVEEGGPLSYFGIPDWLALMIYIAVGLLVLIILAIRFLGVGRKIKRRRQRRRRNANHRRSEAPIGRTELSRKRRKKHV